MKRPSIPNPTSPGEILLEEYINPLGISQSSLAKEIGVSFRTINEICNEKRAITPKVAMLFADYFKTTPEYWMKMQMACDLWKEWQKHQKREKAS